MIAYLKGRLAQKDPARVTIEVGGVGYEVQIPLSTYAAIKDQENIQLSTVLVIKDDAHLLYGFGTENEKALFQKLVSVNGIGPATALLALSYMSATELRQAITTANVQALQAIKGVSTKTAQRMVLELKDKLGGDLPESEGIMVENHNTKRLEALTALVTLGISKSVAERNVDAILRRSGDLSLEELIKQALNNA